MAGRAGGLHHVEIYVADLPLARDFWGWWLGELGWTPFQDWDQGFSLRQGRTYLVFVLATHLDRPFHRCRPGLNHLAFHAESRAQLNRLTDEVVRRGWTLLYPERHPHAGGPDSVALFFEGPERLKVELCLA
jgi:catechol 2,3-dioxygenase-like lactoylglutathione lyase family enzyme